MDASRPPGAASNTGFDLPHLVRLLDFFHETVSLSSMVITITRYDDASCAYVSPTFREMTGYEAEFLREGGMNWLVNHMHVEDRAQFKINFSESFLFLLTLPAEQRLRCYFNLTARLLHQRGTALWIYYQCRPIALDQEGRPQYSLNLIADLTQLMPAAAAQPCWSVVEHQDGVRPVYLAGSCNDSMRWLFGSMNSPLTRRETEILKGLMKGATGKELAARLKVSPNTVNTHRKSIIRKCRARNINQAIDLAVKNDWINE